METIWEGRGSSATVEGTPVMKNVFDDFLLDLNNISDKEKLSRIYTYFTGKKPNPNLSIERMINRVLYEVKFGEKIKETEKMLGDEKKQYKFPWKIRRMLKKSRKEKDKVLVEYLNIKGESENLRVYPLYSGNMVIIRNKPYEVDPRAFWSFGKYKKLVIKEIDRRPVSNLDYTEIKKRGDATDSDEILIKATLKAWVSGLAKKQVSKVAWIIGGVALVGIIIFFLVKGG